MSHVISYNFTSNSSTPFQLGVASGAITPLATPSSRRSRLFEAFDEAGDVEAGGLDAGAAQLDEGGGAGDALREVVDVDVLPLELGEDRLQLVHRVGVGQVRKIVVSHRRCS